MSVRGTSKVLRGRVHVYGSHITTDQILPGRYLDRSYEEVGRYAMAGVDEGFADRVSSGDFLVAGPNFGCGSSREAAVIALKQAGVAAVMAPSFAGIFFRNAINNGLFPIVVARVDGIRTGDELEVDLERRIVRHFGSDGRKAVLAVRNLTGISLEILEAGGILPHTRRRLWSEGTS